MIIDKKRKSLSPTELLRTTARERKRSVNAKQEEYGYALGRMF